MEPHWEVTGRAMWAPALPATLRFGPHTVPPSAGDDEDPESGKSAQCRGASWVTEFSNSPSECPRAATVSLYSWGTPLRRRAALRALLLLCRTGCLVPPGASPGRRDLLCPQESQDGAMGVALVTPQGSRGDGCASSGKAGLKSMAEETSWGGKVPLGRALGPDLPSSSVLGASSGDSQGDCFSHLFRDGLGSPRKHLKWRWGDITSLPQRAHAHGDLENRQELPKGFLGGTG